MFGAISHQLFDSVAPVLECKRLADNFPLSQEAAQLSLADIEAELGNNPKPNITSEHRILSSK